MYHEPICAICKRCIGLKKRNHRIFDVSCEANPNLGAVSVNYQKCCSFKSRI